VALSAGLPKTTAIPFGLDRSGTRAWSAALPTLYVPANATPQPMRRVLVAEHMDGVGCAYGAGVDRVSVWAMAIRPNPGVIVAKPALPGAISFVVKASVGCCASQIAAPVWTAGSWEDNGFLFQVTGPLCEAYELFIAATAGGAIDVQLELAVYLDRQGGSQPLAAPIVLLGPNVA
jgi:hypothetical protein